MLAPDNAIQISRDVAEEHLFFSWVDTTFDGIEDNFAPALHVAARRLSDDALVGTQDVAGGPRLGGRTLCPGLGPEVIETDDGFKLPILFAYLFTGDQMQPIPYLGLGASIESDALPEESGEDAGYVGPDVGTNVGDDVGVDVGEDVGAGVEEDTADVGVDAEPDA